MIPLVADLVERSFPSLFCLLDRWSKGMTSGPPVQKQIFYKLVLSYNKRVYTRPNPVALVL